MAVEYKFKPYTPVNLKLAPTQASLSQQEKTRRSLESQRANLDARLRAEGIDPGTLGGEFDNRNLIEKALNLTPDQGLLMDFFEVINRPVESVKSAIAAGLDGESVLEGAWKGISGQEVIEGSKLFTDLTAIEPQTKLGKFVLNIGTDILLDPLTYLPPGYIIKGFRKLSRVGSRTYTRVAEEIVSNSVKMAGKVIAEGTPGFVKNTDEMQALIKETADYLEAGAKGTVAEGFAKNRYQSMINDYIIKNGLVDLKGSYNVVLEGAQKVKGGANLKDLAVYFKVTDQSGVDKWVKISRVEVKEVLQNAWAFKGAFGLDDITQDLITKGNGSIFINRIKGFKTKNGEDVAKILTEYLEGGRKGRFNFLSEKNFTKEQIGQIQEIVKDVLFEDLQRSGIKYMSFQISDTRAVTMSLENARKYVRITNTRAGVNTSGVLSKGSIKKILAKAGIDEASVTIIKTSKKAANANKYYRKVAKNVVENGKDLIVGSGNILLEGLSKDDALKLLGQDFVDASGKTFKVNQVGILEDGTVVLAGTNASDITNQIQSGLDLIEPGTKNKLTEEFIDANNLDETEAFLGEFLTGQTQSTTITETLTLAGRARAGEFDKISPLIKRIARAIKNIEMNLKINFNLTAALSDEAKALIKKAYGENLFELERRSARLAQLKADLIKVDPQAGELLGEIIEAGARITPDGRIIKMRRRMGTSDFLDYVLVRTQDKAEILLPKFPDEVAKKNFLRTLNDMYRDFSSTTDDFFEVIEQGAGTALRFDGGPTEIQDFIKYFNEKNMLKQQGFASNIPDYVEFGEKALSKKAQQFLTSNGKAIDEYRGLSDEILQELVDVAGFENLPRELAGQIGYMRHIMSMEAYKALQRQMPEVASIFARPGMDTLKQRTFIGSAQEVNAGMREFMGLEMDLFDPNAFNAMEDLIKVAQRKLDQSRILDIILTQKGVNAENLLRVVPNTTDFAKTLTPYDKMFKSFKEEFSALYKNLSPEAQKRLDEFFKASGYGDGKAIVMNKSAYNMLKGAEKAYLEIPQFIKIYDKFLNFWKGTTLVSPGFHLRNLFGNSFNSYAAGMGLADQSIYLTKAVTELNKFQEIGKKLAQGLDITPEEQKLFDLVRGYFESGTSQTHRGIRDLEQLKNAVDVKSINKLKTGYNNVIKFNFNVAEKMDDMQRYALYRWALDKTGDAKKAANKVAEALFDYSHLTPFEKDVMKRMFPFYTFMKNNFIFQAKQIFANPKAYARLGRAYNYAVEDLAGYSIEDLPDYATDNLWLPIPMTVTKNDTEAIAFLKANLPISDFTELVENPFKKGVVSLTAPVKLLIEFGAGRDMFTGAPLQAFPGERRGLEEGTGVLAGLRDPRGNLTISQSPLFQKILGDIGLRTPMNFASVGLDLVDTLAGYQGGAEGLGDFMARMGLVGIQETDKLELTDLYQDLEKLRELKKYYEQETGNQLPVLPRG